MNLDESSGRSILEATAAGVVVHDATGRLLAANPSASRLLGLTSGEVGPGGHIESLAGQAIREDGAPFTGEEFPPRVALRTGKPCQETIVGLRQPDGEYNWLSASSTPLFHPGEMSPHAVVTTFWDISGRTRAERAVGEADRQFRQVAEATSAPILVYQGERIVYANRAAERLTEYTAEEALSMTIFQSAHPEDVPLIREMATRRALGLPVPANYDFRILTKSGKVKWVEAGVGMTEMDGRPAAVAVLIDISDRKAAAAAMRESESLYRLMAENSTDLISRHDLAGVYLYASPASRALLGYEPEELVGRSAYEFFHPEDLELIRQSHSSVVQQTTASTVAYRALRKDGSVAWLETTSRAMPGGDPTDREIVAVSRDISRRMAAQEQMIKLSTAVENSPAAVIMTDVRGRIEYVNRRFSQVTGYPLGEVLGCNPRVLKSGEMSREGYATLWQTITSGQEWRGEFHNRKKNGEMYWASATISPVRDLDGKITYFVGVQEDITLLKQAREELMKAKEAAEAANRAKSDFLASMSHEIRTPLNAIVGATDLLSETELSNDQHRYVDLLGTASGTLLDLINDILDLSKIEAGHLSLESAPFNLEDLLEKTAEVNSVRANAKGVELVCRIAPGTPTALIGDSTRLRQVLTNLIGNAVKFTEKGEVVVEVRPAAPEATAAHGGGLEMARLLFSVRDTGIGIPADKLGTIFERFTQVDSSTTRKYGGTGLGLAITQRLVALMGGTIWVESELGHGSTFYFTIQATATASPVPPAATSEVDMKGVRVLVVDDNATNRLLLREMLSGWGSAVEEAADGPSALTTLSLASGVNPFQLVLLDFQMPEMDGLEVARRIRETPTIRGVPVVLITSDIRGGSAAEVQAAGITEHMSKPVKRSQLKAVIASAIHRTEAARRTVLPAASVGPMRSLRILVAEDSQPNRILLEAFLKGSPHRLDMVEDGAAAVAQFKASDYDLVLMDMQMPVMDGYDATRTLRAWEKGTGRRPTTIVALTAHALREDLERSLEAGCNAYLTKPIKKGTLMDAISSYASQPDPGATLAAKPSAEKIQVRIDPDILDLVPEFLELMRKDTEAMAFALDGGDLTTVRRLGHSMKGAGGGYGFDRLTDFGRSIEEAAKTGDVDRIRPLLGEVSDYLSRVEAI